MTSKVTTTQVVSYAMIALPVIIWLLVNGMYLVTALFWFVLLGVGLLSLVLNRIGQVRGFAEWRLQKGIPVAPLLAIIGTLVVYALLLRTEGGGVPAIILWFTPLILAGAALTGASIETMDDELLQGPGFWLPLLGAIVIGGIALAVTQLGLVDLNAEWFLEPSDPRNWGGFLLTMMLTIYGIIIAFPIGVGLALGRRSDLPAIKYLCTAYIELVRGSPFITVLFFMQLLIPLISADLAEVPNSYRALIATIAFSAAYLAENVRGGLQSLPPGQGEAAKALGLSPLQATLLITLPQALRAVIPALVGQFISLFKDTSLVAIVGLIDLTGFVNSMVVQAEFIGTRSEGLFFISVIYFVFSYLMSYISRLLEASGSGSARRTTV
ncbi:MAG: amino acid ABC transporter permease [Anaerolineae bacterium]|nr:amino acid ABC transporter permease [Anaerolineae bacterium]